MRIAVPVGDRRGHRAGRRPAALADPRPRLRVRRRRAATRPSPTHGTRHVHDRERHPRHRRSARRSGTCSPRRGPCSSSSRSAAGTPVVGSRCSVSRRRCSCSPACFSPLELPGVDTANFFGYVLWSVWLDRLRRRDPRARAPRPPPPRRAGPCLGVGMTLGTCPPRPATSIVDHRQEHAMPVRERTTTSR